ncbi:hypothetical protein SL054_001969 [Flavobacterium psychrophilum]|uniref:hypothetical protein n=1 Tax=Flavobacterium psychrophilum TaxID=96345 RepID=UPI000B7C0B11|nr:hypothetical protein [Flavobacterium psychrophilum]ELY1992619.1 hypothetical protein [Flavobacterium psychrophilum]SNB42159.1 hypothetical protein LVDJXP189_1210031 [Flavobacterium psychrophilum]
MISNIFILEKKLLFAINQGIAWRLRRATEIDPKRRETINTIITMIEDDKSNLRQQLYKMKGTQN